MMILTSNSTVVETLCSSNYTADKLNYKGKVVAVVVDKNAIYNNLNIIKAYVSQAYTSECDVMTNPTEWWKTIPGTTFDIPPACFANECENNTEWQLRVHMFPSVMGPTGFLNITFDTSKMGYAPWGIWVMKSKSKNHLSIKDFEFAYQAAKLYTLTSSKANKKWAQNLGYEFPSVD